MVRLNGALIEGVRVLCVYPEGRKQRDIALLDCQIRLEYDKPLAEDAFLQIEKLLRSASLMVEKRGKNGVTQQDIIPLIRNLQIVRQRPDQVTINARICCQNPALNPAQLLSAIEVYLPECKPDFAQVTRVEIYDVNENVFR